MTRYSKTGEICEIEAIIPSPEITGYRNKCEFTIGVDTEGKPCVGFNLGQFREGVFAVGVRCAWRRRIFMRKAGGGKKGSVPARQRGRVRSKQQRVGM